MVTKAWREFTAQTAMRKHPGDSVMAKLSHSPQRQHNWERILNASPQSHEAQGTSRRNQKSMQSQNWVHGDTVCGTAQNEVLWRTAMASSSRPGQGWEEEGVAVFIKEHPECLELFFGVGYEPVNGLWVWEDEYSQQQSTLRWASATVHLIRKWKKMKNLLYT